MSDSTETIRRQLCAESAQQVGALVADVPVADQKQVLRAQLEAQYGADNVWDTTQLSEHFEVLGFLAPFCVVCRKSDGQKGSIRFTHSPRLYYGWEPHVP